MNDFTAAMQAMNADARSFVTKAGLDLDNMPDWDKQIEAFKKAGITDHETMPKAIRAAFPENGVELGSLSQAHTDALGLKQTPMLRLARGRHAEFGVSHNWRHHKEMFTDIAESQKVLAETLGNPNARCVFSVSPTKNGVKRLIVINNPTTRGYCVLNLSKDGTVARVVSWHRADDNYGNTQWSKN